MTTYNTGTSNYPTNYDLAPTGSTTATISYLLDQIRDSGTGIISQSGDAVVAVQVNSAYTILQKLEETIGLEPQGDFDTIADRLYYLESVSGLAFVPLAGGDMVGALNMLSGVGISVDTLSSSGLVWTIVSGATINSSGNFAINSSSDFTLSLPSNALNLSSNSIVASAANSQIYTTNLNALSGNIISLLSTSGVITNSVFLPSASGSINIGSAGYPFNELYVGSIISTGVNSSFIISSGDTIRGNQTLASGVSIFVAESGNGSLGSISAPFSGIFTKTLYASFISGLSPVTFSSDVVMASGFGITFAASGSNLGTSGNRIDTIYVNVLDANTVAFNGYVNESGDSMTGALTFTSGNSIVLQSGSVYPQTSGVGTVGTTGNYFENVYTNQINGRNVGNLVFNEIAGGTTDGVNKSFTLAHAPLSGYAMIFVSGLLIAPTTQYVLSGVNLGLTGSMYAPSTAPVAGFYIY